MNSLHKAQLTTCHSVKSLILLWTKPHISNHNHSRKKKFLGEADSLPLIPYQIQARQHSTTQLSNIACYNSNRMKQKHNKNDDVTNIVVNRRSMQMRFPGRTTTASHSLHFYSVIHPTQSSSWCIISCYLTSRGKKLKKKKSFFAKHEQSKVTQFIP